MNRYASAHPATFTTGVVGWVFLGLLCLPAPLALSQDGAAADRAEIRLSPQIRSEPLEQVTREIPRELIDRFQVDNLVIDPQEYDRAAHIIDSVDDNLVIGTGDTVLARGEPGSWNRRIRELDIIRMEQAYEDPETGELLGYQGLRIGTARVLDARAEGDRDGLRRVEILRSRQEVHAGDRLMVRPQMPVTTRFQPRPAPPDVRGRVLALLTELSQAAQYDSLLLSTGRRDGVEAGDLLTVFAADRPVTDPLSGETLVAAGQPVATLLVYRVFERLGYGLILEGTAPVSEGFRVASPR
ncbi:MAG: hypothetical protein ACQETO_07260 [Pseudomonadota bacterium]